MNFPAMPPRGGRGRGRVGARLGEILLARRALAPRELEVALACQPLSARPLGALLAARGWVGEGAVAGALAEQWGLPAVDLAREPADGSLVEPARAELYLRHRVLPWRRLRVGGRESVIHVTDRPEAAAAACAALGAAGAPVAVVSASDLDAALAHHLGPTLATRAATRCPRGESVRSLGLLRPLAAFALLAMAVAIPAGGPAGLAAALLVLLVLNGATTALRFAALVAGLRGDGAGRSWPGEAGAGGPEGNAPAASADGATAAAAIPLASRRPLPMVTLLVPLYREARMVPEILAALAALDWPPELLDVRLLLEADDAETRAAVEAAELPAWVRPLVVPEGAPRTKPRAMNLALDFAEGEIVGILDAEDRPEPDQLRRVVAALMEAPPEVACVQCQLGWYNARETWLTRCFELEYAIWFAVLLRGFGRLGLPIPLGGTSVYFRRGALERLGGWDAHNVTEDADLGMRLARQGMRCRVIDCLTREEASARLVPWVRQRSRWLKGYLLTWLSHIRRPARLWRELGPWGFLGFNVLFLGGIASYLAMPLFWLALGRGIVTGEALWGGLLPPVLGVALALSLGAGQGVMLASAALAMWRRRAFDLLLWVPVLPFYWTLGALAAWKALVEVLLAPWWWDKTRHGLSRVFAVGDGERPAGDGERPAGG